jgi:hypothetical protein
MTQSGHRISTIAGLNYCVHDKEISEHRRMTLEDWAAIAEIVGALAVVLTLVYLAVQVKHSKEALDANTKAIRGQVISDVTRNVQDHMMMMVQGHDLITTVKIMATEEELDPDNALLLDMLLTAVFVARQNEYFQWKQGLLDDSVFRSLHHITFTIMGTPSGRHWWQHEGSKLVAPEFVKFVEQLDEDGPAASVSSWKSAIRVDENKLKTRSQ